MFGFYSCYVGMNVQVVINPFVLQVRRSGCVRSVSQIGITSLAFSVHANEEYGRTKQHKKTKHLGKIDVVVAAIRVCVITKILEPNYRQQNTGIDIYFTSEVAEGRKCLLLI